MTNEIQFLSWDEFRRMAPSILQLEVTRIGEVLSKISLDIEHRNGLVRARHAMKEFIACVENERKQTIQSSCEPLLARALVNMPLPEAMADVETAHTIEYIVDRLQYVIHRIPLIY